MPTSVPLLTRKGRENLGKILKYYRLKNNWSMDQLVEVIKAETQHPVSKAAISDLERGNTDPKWDTLAILASVGYLPYSVNQMFAIASEQINPDIEDNLANNRLASYHN